MISQTLIARVLLGDDDALEDAEAVIPDLVPALRRTGERLRTLASPELLDRVLAAQGDVAEVERILTEALQEALREFGPGLH